MNWILFGFKGAGKSYWGEKLAKELNRPFIDTDPLIELLYAAQTGEKLSNKEIFQRCGERAFRLLESQVIHNLRETKNAVIALGGGAVLDPQNLLALQKIGHLIYLKATLNTLQKRGITHVGGSIEVLYEKRMPIYQSIPAYMISIEKNDVMRELLSLVKRGNGC